MEELEVVIKFSNDEKLIVNKKSLLFPIKFNEKLETSGLAQPVVLEDNMDPHEGLIPVLSTMFAANEYFYIEESEPSSPYKTIYKTSSIVSFSQRKKFKAGIARMR